MDPNTGRQRSTLRRIARRAMIDRGLLPDFSHAALAELDGIRANAAGSSGWTRDMRNLPWASIDNDDSRDLDQLTVAETMPEGAVKILVAIADVDAIVRQGKAIDDHDWQNKKAGEKQASTGNRSATGEKEGGTANSATP